MGYVVGGRRRHDSKYIGVHNSLRLLRGISIQNRIIPGENYCRPGKQCRILTTILAFSWIGWSFLTIIGTMGLMYYAYSSGQPATRDHEKAAEATGNS